MRRYLPVLSLFLVMACHDKVVCPSYQSKFILDDSTRNAFFSYVWQLDEVTRSQYLAQHTDSISGDDSLGMVAQPKTDYYAYAGEKVVPWRVQNRNKYGIIKYQPNWLRRYRRRTAPMENVFGPEPLETTLVADEALDSLATDSISIASASSDSLNVAEAMAKWEEEKEEIRFLYNYDPNDNFNVEQEYYNKYYAEKFIDKRPLPPPFPLDSLGNPILPDSTAQLTDKEPFFKRLFGNISDLFKKKEAPSDTTAIGQEDPFADDTEE